MTRPHDLRLNQGSRPPRLLVVEENLRSRKGHYFQYAYALAHGQDSPKQLQIEFGVHRKADVDVLTTFQAHPIFPRSRLEKSRLNKVPGFSQISFLLHNLAVFRCLARHLRKRGPYDYILFPTASFHQILGAYLTQAVLPRLAPRLALFFVQQCTSWPGGKPAPVFDRTAPVVRLELSLFRTLVRKKRTVLAAETARAQREFRDLTGLPVGLWPHPVSAGLSGPARGRQGGIVFGSFGFARHEKGSDLLAEAVERCLGDPRFAKARFVLQWGEDYTDATGRRVTLSKRVRTDPRVAVIDWALDELQYSESLASVSVLLLPYRRSSYYGRLSRVSIEGACLGIPMIATPETHLASVIDEMGAGLLMEGESGEHLVAAMARLLGCAPQLTEQAVARAPQARRYFSPEAFMETMIRSFDV